MKSTNEVVWLIIIGVITTVIGALVYDKIKTRKPSRVLNFPTTAVVQ